MAVTLKQVWDRRFKLVGADGLNGGTWGKYDGEKFELIQAKFTHGVEPAYMYFTLDQAKELVRDLTAIFVNIESESRE